jgi:uncharacterized membrane protein YczE
MAGLGIGFLSCGAGIAAMVQARLGLGPWDIFHQGIARVFGVSIGIANVAVGLVVMLCWVPFRQKPGIGTALNIAMIGPCANLFLAILPHPQLLAWRIGYMMTGMPLLAFGTALYLSSNLGPGPRDGLMLSLTRRFGLSVRLARTLIECSAFLGGWLMGGDFGLGSLYFALAIGPSLQGFILLLQRAGLWYQPLLRDIGSPETPDAGIPGKLAPP